MPTKNTFLTVLAAMLISGCGGGGGGGDSTPTTPTTPAPVVSLSASPISVLLTETSTLTWSSSNATSCSASGSWSGTKTTSGSEVVTISASGNNTFTLTCTGAGGNGSRSVTVEGYRNSNGVVVDGYISGADIFIDENDNWTKDSNENSTTSDNDGKFTIKYANGNLVSVGGTDLDSQTFLDNLLITHKLTGHSDFKAVTPVTSVAAFMNDAVNVNAALGIDSTIDVAIFDPVANKGDGGINDYLYEKGNQLTILAYALQNVTNDLNITIETTQDYFKAITEEIETEFAETSTKVDIETEAFITKALDNVIAAKSLTIADEAKANTINALSGVLPIIEVKSSADLTTSVIRFAVSTLQTDIKGIANGTASAETLTSYTNDVLNYIASDQNIDPNEITPGINAIADSALTSEDTAVAINVLANDSFITTAPITVTSANGSNGSTSVSSNVITYMPQADFNGADTFKYTITQGDKTSSADVTITIEAVNDAPSIDTASTIQAAENQTAVATISVSDVDEDDLTLTLSGTDAESFNLSTDNVLTFKEAPDYETKSSYSITLSLTDGTETVEKNIIIQIIKPNEYAPVFGSTSYLVDERQKQIGTIDVTDQDNDPINIYLSGGDASFFVVNSSFRTISFKNIPIYSEKNKYVTTIFATDGTFTTSKELIVNINEIPKEDVNHPQAIVGTSGNDILKGEDAQYDILIGLEGNDNLDGGQNNSPFGGYHQDIYQFGDNSGNDTIIGFFIADNYKKDGYIVHDIIEIIQNINGTGLVSADEILKNSSEDSGNAVLNLGQGNTVKIEGISLDEMKPEFILITYPYSSVVQGTDDDDDLNGIDDQNSRIEGSNDPFDRFEDGSDILRGSSGNDVMIGGTNKSPFGGFLYDRYEISHNSGDDIIYGFYDPYNDGNTNEDFRSDKILLPYFINETNIDSFTDLIAQAETTLDDWVKFNLGQGNELTLHNIKSGEIFADNIIFTFSDYIENKGTSDNDFIYGTDKNDWLLGDDRFMDRFHDGYDYLFSRNGNDILEGGENNSATGGPSVPNNYFIDGSGFKTIIGFSSVTHSDFNPYTKQSIDRIFFPKNSQIQTSSDIPFVLDDDGFINLIIDDETTILLHGIKSQEVILENFIVHDPIDEFIIGTKEDDTLIGTNGNDFIDGYMDEIISSGCVGYASGHDLINGGEGNDVLIGGHSEHFCGGFNIDTFIFLENSGVDQILDFTAEWELPGYVDSGKHRDFLQIEKNINGLDFSTATEIISRSTDNSSGFAEIDLGAGNKVTLVGKKLENITPFHIRIVPKIANVISGEPGEENDILVGTDENDFLKGSPYPSRRHEDGFDILDGGKGDDALDGGVYDSPFGGTIIDIYRFDRNYGNDIIFGFYAADIEDEGIQASPGIRSDKIEIPNDVVTSSSTLISNSQNNEDNFAVLSFDGTTVTMHGIAKEQLKNDYFFIVPRVTNTITGNDDGFQIDENDVLIGTDGNDRLNGSPVPFDRFEDGSDILDGGKGDDILSGGDAKSPYGGYIYDRYRFNEDFGNDFVTSLRIVDGGYRNNGDYGAIESDRLEINNMYASTASEVIDNTVNNDDGWAVIQLGDNSITLFGISKEELKPDFFHIIPSIDNYISGTGQTYGAVEDDELIGTDGNDYIEGSKTPIDRFSDGSDYLEGGQGDDVLIGGTNKNATCCTKVDTYNFGDNSDNDLIIGFMVLESSGNTDYRDIIQLKSNINESGITDFNSVIENTVNNADGWAVINLGGDNSITLHGITKENLAQENFQFF